MGKKWLKLSLLFLIILSFTCFISPAEAESIAKKDFEREEIVDYSLLYEEDGTFYLQKTNNLSSEEENLCNEVICIKTLDDDAYNVWKQVFSSKSAVSQSLSGSAYNTLYTIYAPGSWVRVNAGSSYAMVASYLEMSFTRGGSSWTSKLANEYVNNQ